MPSHQHTRREAVWPGQHAELQAVSTEVRMMSGPSRSSRTEPKPSVSPQDRAHASAGHQPLSRLCTVAQATALFQPLLLQEKKPSRHSPGSCQNLDKRFCDILKVAMPSASWAGLSTEPPGPCPNHHTSSPQLSQPAAGHLICHISDGFPEWPGRPRQGERLYAGASVVGPHCRTSQLARPEPLTGAGSRDARPA